MIEEITFKNVLSFKDEVTLSFEATDDSNLESPHVVTMPNGTRLLKVGIIYGANASGKSNLLYAIDNLREFWFADPQNMDVPTGFEPFLLDTDTPNQPSEYSIKFWVNGIRYWYQLTATNKRVIFEKLSYYKTVQPIRIFDRKLEDGQSVLSFNPSVQKIGQEEQKTLSLNCLPNKSFFAVRGRVNMKMEHVDAIRQWIHSQFMPMLSPSINMTHYCQKKIGENADFKEYLLNFLHLADFNITGLNNHFQEEIIPQQVQSFLLKEDTLPEDLKKKFFSQSGFKKYIIGFEHTVENERGKETYELGMEQQSAGTRRVMGIESTIYEAIENNAFLMIDEMESSIHPDLMEYILQEYLLKPSESQLLITTHYSGLFNTIDDLIRKDNIWFVEKGKNGSTDLFSLVEFKGLNKVTHFERVYRKGMFGALPNIKNWPWDDLHKKYDHDKRVTLGCSMPSIEYWFLLHYENTNRNLRTSHDAIKASQKYIVQFDKKENFLRHQKWVAELIKDGKMDAAMKRAEVLSRSGSSYTDVWKAIKDMKE